MKWLITILFSFFWGTLQMTAQEIILFECTPTTSAFEIDSTGYLLSSFNPNGRTTTPAFLNDETLLVSANFPDSTQMDLWKIHIPDSSLSNICTTEPNEIAPKPDIDTPKRILFLRSTDSLAPQLWFYPLSQTNQGNRFLATPEGNRILDYAPLGKGEIALLVNGTPYENRDSTNKILIVGPEVSYPITLANKVAPHLQTLDGSLYYIHQILPSTRYLKRRDSHRKQSSIITSVPLAIDAFCILDPTSFLVVSNTNLYYYSKHKKASWIPIVDFRYLGVKSIKSIQHKNGKLLMEAQLSTTAK